MSGRSLGLAGVLLAAGLSRRMQGPNKLALRVDGEPLLRRTARTLLEAGVAPLVVVLGHDASRIAGLLEGLAVHCIENPDHLQGQASSVQAGLRALSPLLAADTSPDGSALDSLAPDGAAPDGFMICLADLVLLQPSHLAELAQAFAAHPQAQALIPWRDGQRGHPVLLRRALLPALIAHPQGPRGWMESHPQAVLRLPVHDVAYTTDLDSPDDLRALLARADAPDIRLPDGGMLPP